ncbi:MAG: helix-turn-helix domain-containing protein [Bacteroidales bacterium]|nr:helix-turn-helix domain-containing protein [Bacteroidales bacterium]
MEPVYFKVPRHPEETVRVENWVLPRFYEPFHYHEECQLTLILRSTGNVFVGNNLIDFSEGDLFLIGSNLPHVFRHDGFNVPLNGNRVSAISVFSPLSAILKLTQDIPEALRVNSFLEESVYGFKYKAASEKKIGRLMRLLGKSSGFSKLLMLLEIIDLFSQNHQKEQLTYQNFQVPDLIQGKNLTKVFDYVMARYNEKIKLEEVASLVCMTPNSFCRFFKRHTLKTFSEFLINVRVSMACKKLQEEDTSVSDSCYSSGYNNISNFHRHFRRIVGLTPNEYKKQITLTSV